MSDSGPSEEVDAPRGSVFRRLVIPVLKGRLRALADPKANLGALILGGSVLFFGLLVMLLIAQWTGSSGGTAVTVENALAQLDLGNWEEARSLATQLARRPLPEQERGAPYFLLGVVTRQDALLQKQPQQRRLVYLLAGRYLQEARTRGFPPPRRAQGLYLLGRSLHDSGHYSEALPVLRQVLEEAPGFATETHRLLASAYLEQASPQLAEAEQHARRYLEDGSLTHAQLAEGGLQLGRVLFWSGQLDASRGVLEGIRPTDPMRGPWHLLQARQILRDARNALAGAELEASDIESASQRLLEAIKSLRVAIDTDLANQQFGRKAQYLIGVCYRTLAGAAATASDGGQQARHLQTALREFSRTRRAHFATPAGLAAGIQEAEILQSFGDDSKALASYQRVLRDVQLAGELQGPWINNKFFQDRMNSAYGRFLEQEQFAMAVQLAGGFSPLFPVDQALSLEAGALAKWAAHLDGQAAEATLSRRELILVDARQTHRAAGATFERLAGHRFATRMYPADLWESAWHYLEGQNYDYAINVLETHLQHVSRRERPRALVAMGRAHLARLRPTQALLRLNECIESHPRHPDTYAARLTAALAHAELGDVQRSRALLEDNLHGELLTPRSIEFRNSLFTLGRLQYQEASRLESVSRLDGADSANPRRRQDGMKVLQQAWQEFQEALGSLRMAVRRYPDDSRVNEARYMIGEAYRQSSKLPRKSLPLAQLDKQRDAYISQVNANLATAVQNYDQLILGLNTQKQAGDLSDLHKVLLRNGYFARADALYDLARFSSSDYDYEDAIRAYAAATNLYQSEPKCLEAYLQIAACYRALNLPEDARGTLEQAKVVLGRMRKDADYTKTTRYKREKWEQLLNWLAAS